MTVSLRSAGQKTGTATETPAHQQCSCQRPKENGRQPYSHRPKTERTFDIRLLQVIPESDPERLESIRQARAFDVILGRRDAAIREPPVEKGALPSQDARVKPEHHGV
ncbi:hypothetical protein [Bosea sp. NBC_00550]|uniref:hypothetical protein n=1 Tax=Bosea sp. NBC_00550 TaxID=2969621 RepID=UPI002231AA25|nr:hypothetical protein [Bosea sp. NBC_00550]UZF94417.1 hypothetical protein NWE53_09650 [Bosea sp. NBC_00550]